MDKDIVTASFIICDETVKHTNMMTTNNFSNNHDGDGDDDDESIDFMLEPLTRQKSSRTLGLDFDISEEDLPEPPELCTTRSLRKIADEVERQHSSTLRAIDATIERDHCHKQGFSLPSPLNGDSDSTLLMEPDDSWHSHTSLSSSNHLGSAPRRNRSWRRSAAKQARMANVTSYEQRIQQPSEMVPGYEPVSTTKRSSTGAELVEVAPGVIAQFVGTTDETWEAILDGNVNVIACTCCGVHLHCMDVSQLVICPECKVVSPTNNEEDETSRRCNNKNKNKLPVVGVGFTSETIIEWMKDT